MPGQTEDHISFPSRVFKDVAGELEEAGKERSNQRRFFLNLEHVATVL